MSEKKRYLEFRKVLKECLSNVSQREFARQLDISPEHLNRMLNQDFIGQPRRRLLDKLYEVRPDLKGKYDLFELCGYNTGLSEIEKIHEKLHDIEVSLESLYEYYKFLYPDLDSLVLNTMGLIRSLNLSQGEYSVMCTIEKEMSDSLVLDVTVDSRNYSVHKYFGIVYTHQNDVIIPVSVHQDGAWFEIHDCLPKCLKAEYEKCQIDVNRLNSVFYLSKKSKDDVANGLSNEILGIGEEYETTVTGFGFYLTELTDDNLLKFFYNHQESFKQEELEELEHLMESSKDCRSALKDYMCECTSSTGFGSLISNVMSRETGHHFGFQNETDFIENQACIMCMDDVPLVDNMLVYNYAKELGISYIQQVYVKMTLFKDLHSIIKVE